MASSLSGSSEAFSSKNLFTKHLLSRDSTHRSSNVPSRILLDMSTVQVREVKPLYDGFPRSRKSPNKFVPPEILISPPPTSRRNSRKLVSKMSINQNSSASLSRFPWNGSRKNTLLRSSNDVVPSFSYQEDSEAEHEYKTESSETNRITKEEEFQLIASVQALHDAILVRDSLAILKSPHALPHIPNPMYKGPILPYANEPSEEEWAEACNMTSIQLRKTIVAGRDARSRLVSGNVGLVLQIARRYEYELKKSVIVGGGRGMGTILTLSDLIQEGNLGLMEAAAKFKFDKGVRFGTYASYWIRQRILRAITDNSRVIRLPAHVHNHLRTIRKARAEMTKEIGREPSTPELAHRLEMPVEKLQLYNDSSRSVLSLEVPVSTNGISAKSGSGERDRRTLGDLIASDIPTPDEDAQFEGLKQDIRDAIDALGNERERDVLIDRFGLLDGKVRTLEETGQRLGISRERVRVLENRALNKLRHPQRNHRLKEYVGNNQGSEDQEAKLNLFGIPNSKGDSLSSPEKIWSF